MDRQARSYQRTSISRAIIAGCLLLCACSAAIAQSPDLPRKAAPPHAVSPHFFGVNIENSYMSPPVIAWDDPTLLRAIKQVGIQTVRFPGGDVGNYWDWQNGTVYPLGKASKTQDTLSALSNLVHATGAYPIYNLNVMTLNNAILHRADLSQGISNQLRMLDAAHDMKLPVADLELGKRILLGLAGPEPSLSCCNGLRDGNESMGRKPEASLSVRPDCRSSLHPCFKARAHPNLERRSGRQDPGRRRLHAAPLRQYP